MSVRELGLRRVGAVTTGLAAASIAGSLALAAAARASTQTTDPSTTVDQPSTEESQNDQGTAPQLSTGDGPAHARSGGS